MLQDFKQEFHKTKLNQYATQKVRSLQSLLAHANIRPWVTKQILTTLSNSLLTCIVSSLKRHIHPSLYFDENWSDECVILNDQQEKTKNEMKANISFQANKANEIHSNMTQVRRRRNAKDVSLELNTSIRVKRNASKGYVIKKHTPKVSKSVIIKVHTAKTKPTQTTPRITTKKITMKTEILRPKKTRYPKRT